VSFEEGDHAANGVSVPADQLNVPFGSRLYAESGLVAEDGWAFAGWYTSDGSKWDFASGVFSSMTLTARYKTQVSFDKGTGPEGVVVRPSMQVVDGAAVVKLPAVSRVPAGWVFAGWFTSSGVRYSKQPVTGPTVLTARWKVGVSFDKGAYTGDLVIPSVEITQGGTVSEPAVSGVAAGWEFEGWFAGNADTAFDFTNAVNAPITLTARWKVVVSFGVGVHGVGSVVGVSVPVGGVLAEPSVPTAVDGWVFAGWLVGGTQSLYSFGSVVDGPLGLVAGWRELTGDVRVSLSSATLSVPAQTYTGKAVTPAVTVKSGTSVLRAGTDYTLSYVNNVKVGNATVTVTGKGLYFDSKQVTFQIVPAKASALKVVVNAGYAWKLGKQVKPASSTVKVTLNGVVLRAGVDYTLSYGSNRKVGKGTVKVVGKAGVSGSRSVVVKIVPKTSKVLRAVVAKKSVKVEWRRVSKTTKVTKYQLRYRVKGAAKWVTKTYSAKSVKATVKKLKKGKVYQFQVRSYKTVSKVKYYSAWSATKSSKKVK
jgi:uncharacterized repeat protein (TIGR02543 family)